MNRIFYILLLLVCSSTLFSCQKVIDVNLNEAEPRIVIEANVNDQPGPYFVKLTQTVNFDAKNNFPAVTGATVKLSDDAGNTEILSEVQPGIYQTSSITGTPGRTYTLDVTASGKTYTAVSKMAPPVPIDSLNTQAGFFREVKNAHIFFTDPAGTKNWYRFVETVNSKVSTEMYITEDLLRDGQQFDELLFTPDEDSLSVGDSVTIALQAIDEGAYTYFRTLLMQIQGGGQQTSPANPTSNFTNGALGYFSAYAETKKYVFVK